MLEWWLVFVTRLPRKEKAFLFQVRIQTLVDLVQKDVAFHEFFQQTRGAGGFKRLGDRKCYFLLIEIYLLYLFVVVVMTKHDQSRPVLEEYRVRLNMGT